MIRTIALAVLTATSLAIAFVTYGPLKLLAFRTATELIVHIAYDDEEMRGATADHPDWGAAWRQRDFQFFTSDTFRRLLQESHIKLVTWRRSEGRSPGNDSPAEFN
jgi:hypothetical protein